MAKSFSGADVQHLGALLGTGTVVAMSDIQLIDRFASSRGESSELAFAALVARHGPMVLGVCLRILRNEQAAEDAFQATFLVLACRAGQFPVEDSLGRWLYGVSRRVAGRALKAQGRTLSLVSDGPRTIPPDAAEIADLRRVLDEEVGRLPSRLRESVILCLLEGLTLNEAANRMGCAVGTAGSRLSRARDLLRTRLTRRGFSPAICILGSPDLLAIPSTSLIRSATLLASVGLSGSVPGPVGMLVRSILKEMMMTRTFASAVLVAGSLAATGAVMAAMLSSPPQAPRPIAPAVARQKPDPSKTMRVAVRGPQGQPVSGAKITAGVWTEEKGFKPTRNYETDASGVAQVDLPETFYILRLWASKKPFGTLYAGWEQDELASGRGVPAQYTFSLETVTGASGQIVNEDGRPIVGAKVQVGLSHDQSAKPAKGDGRVRYDAGLAERCNEAITDAEGRWRIDNVPDHPGVKLSLLVTHPDYVSDESWEGLQQAGSVTTEMLRKGTATLALKPGVIVEGRVSDPEGKPITEGLIIHGDDPYFASKSCDFPIGADGRFRLPALPSGKMTLTLIAPGYAPQLRRVHLKADSSRQDFQMEPGKPIRLRIIDAAGKPIPRATVSITEWMGKKSLHNHDHPNVRNTKVPRNVDENGVWEWLWAPEAPVELEVGSSGFADVPLKIGGGETTRTIVLKSEHRIAGRVTDAVTGRMIPSFTVILVDVLTTTDAGGRFEFPKVPPVPVSVRVLIGPWEDVDFRSGPSLPILLQPGQRVEVDLGGEGAVLTGRVNLTGKVPSGLDCTYSLNYLVRREPGITVAPIADLGFDARRGWRDLWTKTNEGLAYLSTLRHWFVKLAPDGSFSIGGIPAGEYDLAVAIYAKPDGCLVDPLAQSVARVTVTAADAAGRNLTVPDIAAEVLPVPTVGDLPTLAFWGISDARATIGDYHGQYLLAHFWASWCGPCKQQLPAIRRIHEQYAPRGLATLGFSLDEDPKAWKSALKGLDLPWPQGRLTTAGVTGIASVPAYWLLDREGKIVAKAVDPDELAALLADLRK